MEDGIEFDLALKNEMSGPAQEAKKSIHALAEEAGLGGEAIAKLGKHVKEAGEHAKESKGVFEEFGKSMIPQIALGELAAEGIKKVGQAMIEGVKFAIQASEFKENMTDAYAVILNGAEEGKAMFKEVDKLAATVHMPAEKAHELASSLMMQGLKSEEAVQSTIAAVSDLQRTGLAAGADKLQGLIGRSLASGHFDVKSRQLKGTGVSIDELYLEIARNMHKGVAQVKLEMKEGKISTEDGVLALTNAIDKGKVGVIAAGKYGIGDAVTDIKNKVRGLFQEADAGPVVDAFKHLAESIAPGTDGAKEFKDVLDGIISLTGGLVDMAGTIGSAFGTAFSTIKSLATGAMGLLRDAGQKVQDLLGTKADKDWSKQAEKDVDTRVNKDIENRHGGAWWESHKGQQVTDKELEDMSVGLSKDVPQGPSPEAKEKAAITGKDIGTGLALGLQFSEEQVRAAGVGLGKAAHEGAKAGADAHSPSRKMMSLGEDMADGLMLGWEGALGDVHESLSGVMPPKLTAAGAAGSGGKQITIEVGGIAIHGVAHAEDILTLLPSALTDVLEQAALEMGA